MNWDYPTKLISYEGVVDVLGTTLLCAIHGAIVENILFEGGDEKNTLCVFNPTQAKKPDLMTYR